MSKRKMVQISLRVEADLLKDIEKMADFFKVSRSTVINIALIQFMHDVEHDSVLLKNVKGVK